MNHFNRLLQFAGWPVITGILIAVVLLQYQQLERLSDDPLPQIPATPATTQNLPFSEAIRKAAPSVVSIVASTLNVESIEQATDDSAILRLGERASLGSGVIVSEHGFILTNLHVVDSLFDAFDTIVTLNDGRSIPGTVVGWDEETDLAILHVNMDDLTPIDFGNERNMQVGDVVFAIGYPRNIGQSVSQGIISSLSRIHNPGANSPVLQTDAAINPGNSGGALIDRNGNLVGINSSIFSESGNFEGIGFATPVSTATRVIEQLIAEAIESKPGYLGVITGEVLNEETSMLFFGVPDIKGMLVENVIHGGPAERAGVKPGDVITRVEDTPVVNEENIILEIQNNRPGDQILIQVYRNGRTITLPTILGFGQAIVFEP
ncbi:MAG: trypsin-like peptidase domain-containing protein [Pseudohongiellaceae bacterium]